MPRPSSERITEAPLAKELDPGAPTPRTRRRSVLTLVELLVGRVVLPDLVGGHGAQLKPSFLAAVVTPLLLHTDAGFIPFVLQVAADR